MGAIRSWATPITIGSFVLSTITGVVLFFHWNLGLSKPAHEWLSWFMVIGVGLHLVINWKAFKGYFSKRVPVVVMLVFFLVTVLSLLPLTGGEEGGVNRRTTFMKTMKMLQESPISAVATIKKTSSEELIARLTTNGYQVIDASQTLMEVAKINDKDILRLMSDIVK